MLLPSFLLHRGDSTLVRIIPAWIRHDQLIVLLDAQRIIIDQYIHRLTPEHPIHIDPEVVESDLSVLAHLARQLTESEDPLKLCRFYLSSFGTAEDHLRREIVGP